MWKLECPQCENHLRHDPLWSVTPMEIPETYDETKTRERSEKAGKMDRERQLAVALEQLAPLGQLPGALTQFLAQMTGTPAPAAALAGTMECENGHANAAGLKFCGECGTAMSQPVAAAALPAAEPAPEPPAAQGPLPRLRDQNKNVLRALAREKGVDDNGTNAELVSRLSAAGVTNRHLAAYLESASVAA